MDSRSGMEESLSVTIYFTSDKKANASVQKFRSFHCAKRMQHL